LTHGISVTFSVKEAREISKLFLRYNNPNFQLIYVPIVI